MQGQVGFKGLKGEPYSAENQFRPNPGQDGLRGEKVKLRILEKKTPFN